MFCSVPHGIIHMGGSRILTSTVAFLFTKAKGIWLDLWHNSAGWRSIDHTAIPYREVQGKPCNQNREPTMRTGFPCNESRFFPCGNWLTGKSCKLYRVWVYSAFKMSSGHFTRLPSRDINRWIGQYLQGNPFLCLKWILSHPNVNYIHKYWLEQTLFLEPCVNCRKTDVYCRKTKHTFLELLLLLWKQLVSNTQLVFSK